MASLWINKLKVVFLTKKDLISCDFFTAISLQEERGQRKVSGGHQKSRYLTSKITPIKRVIMKTSIGSFDSFSFSIVSISAQILRHTPLSNSLST